MAIGRIGWIVWFSNCNSDMMEYRFSNPKSVVEVSKSPLDRAESGNKYTIFNCLCRLYGYHKTGPRKTYQVTATTPTSAAQFAIEMFRKDFFSDGNESG